MIARVWEALLKAAPVRLWALIGSGPPLTIFAAAVVAILTFYPWPLVTASQRIQLIGWHGLAALFLVLIMQVALAAVRVKGSGPGGTGFEIDGDSDEPAVITTTTTTEVTPPAAAKTETETKP